MKKVIAANGVEYFTSDLLCCVNAFSTRIGGISKHSHTFSLNLGTGRGDTADEVRTNLELFAHAAGFDARTLVSMKQTHSSAVRTVRSADCGKEYYIDSDETSDAYICDIPGIAVGVRTADCVPLLFSAVYDGKAGIVGAAHAGWRGTVAGIAGNTIEKMRNYGVNAEEIRVAIGPAIGKCCFEVRDDFYDKVLNRLGTEMTNRYVSEKDSITGTRHADIVGMNREILTAHGVKPENIDVSTLCTCCHPELFYSHRYSGGVRGTLLSIIKI